MNTQNSIKSFAPTAIGLRETKIENCTERQELEKLYLAQNELGRRARAAPLLFYAKMLERHPKQRAFHDALAVRQKRQRLFMGANRSGKTTAGKNEALAHAYGYRFWEVPDLKLGADGDLPDRESIHPRHWVRRADGIPVRVGGTGMVVSGLPRLRGIGEVIFPGLFNNLPEAIRSKTKVLRGAQGVPDWLELPNGSRILFATEEQDTVTFEGFALDWCWADEPIRQDIYNALQARLFDARGSLWFTLTPLGAKFAWMHETFCVEPSADAEVVTVHMVDNPSISAEDIESFRQNKNFTDRELDARLYGKPECLGDRVFDLFDPKVHVIPTFDVKRKDWTLGLTADPHHRRPTFLAWWAYDPVSRAYHFFKEWPPGNFHRMRDGSLPPAELASVIRNAEGGLRVTHRLCDPRFGPAEHTRHGGHETSFVKLMAEYGLYFDAEIPNTGKIDYGITVVQDLLRFDRNFPVGPTNRPRLLVHDCCPNVINGLMNFGFIDVRDPVKGLYRKVSEEYKDACDVVRYTCLYPMPLTDAEMLKVQRVKETELRDWNDYAD